ncbi:hypothetical protein PYW07_015983 [Mythimna separata]|uniref:DNA repair protein complementing XP-C cells homolog n=1 Tax=Mythimna separata TaxID=271217 RepID=A0AAD7YRS4_MYTSE|nr:hypothetical protein PYW07_015983 [Mythimna separata]
MPTTRKKVIKTVYKDEESEVEDGDFSDSGSDAKISAEDESSSEGEVDCVPSSGDEFDKKSNAKLNVRRITKAKTPRRKPKLTQTLLKKINKQSSAGDENDDEIPTSQFSVKDLTETDKLLPSFLNLSESDSSDDESPKVSKKDTITSVLPTEPDKDSGSDNDLEMEYKDVWSNNIQDNSEEIAKQTFLELEKHKSEVEKTKASLQNYTQKVNLEKESDVTDLLAMGEEAIPEVPVPVNVKKKSKLRRKKDDSDSEEMEDWEEVKESQGVSQQGLQLFVQFPEAACRKSKKVDVEMMMKRKINRVKKEYQVYMHKVHVLCWLGHGNFVSRVLNDQELMAAVLSLVPSKECYPGERVDMKYVEQITTWYKDKLTLKHDKHEDKFRPKAPPLKMILLEQIKSRVVTTKKYLVFIFVTMLRALGLQCRVMFNFVTLPIKPPSSELCSLSTKPKEEKAGTAGKPKSPSVKKDDDQKYKAGPSNSKAKKQNIAQVDGNNDSIFYSDDENIMQVDGNDDTDARKKRSDKRAKANENNAEKSENEDVSPPKIAKKVTGRASPKLTAKKDDNKVVGANKPVKKGKSAKETSMEKGDVSTKQATKTNPKEPIKSLTRSQKLKAENINSNLSGRLESPTKNLTRGQKSKAENSINLPQEKTPVSSSANNTRGRPPRSNKGSSTKTEKIITIPKISVTDENAEDVASKYFEENKPAAKSNRLSRKRSHTANPDGTQSTNKIEDKGTVVKTNARTKSAPGTNVEKSKYFDAPSKETTPKRSVRQTKKEIKAEDRQRVSHRDLVSPKKRKNDVTGDLVNIIKGRVKDAKMEAKKKIVKGKIKKESDEDSDYLPVEDPKPRNSESEDEFKPTKISPKPGTSRSIDRRVLSSASSDEIIKKNRVDVWCEIFVEELEQWISVDVIKGKVHSSGDLYNGATHPVCYIVGWDNNNYLKDLTRKYVPQWNTVTRKLRAEPLWWDQAVKPWLGPKTARDREEDEYLDRMQLEAPLPKSIGEYKNHPLYALKRHLLKFEAIYPPDAAVLGFVRNEPVYARECVYVCHGREIWLKEAKVVKLGETPYKIVKARPKWDKLSNKMITDKPLEVFGPWQVQDYEPPTAENGIVPRNAYGNVELFKECMLPKKTVHVKLPGLNRVAKKLNIDCAPAMTGFDYSGGYCHPVYDGFVVCEEFEEIITDAWVKDQEDQERKEREKIEARVYGNWRRLIRGLAIRERLKCKYGFEEPKATETKKSKGPRLVVKKKP